MKIVVFKIFVLLFFSHVRSEILDICYLIDETREHNTVRHNVEEKLLLAKNISRCLLSRRNDIKIATVLYDDNSARLGFNFERIADILYDGFLHMISNHVTKRSNKGSRKTSKVTTSKRNIIRLFPSTQAVSTLASESPQMMAFLTAAEAVVAAVSKSSGRERNFKVLVLSHSDVFPVMSEVKKYFLNTNVEVNAVDLSWRGSSELKRMVTSPFSGHYIHNPDLTAGRGQIVADYVCQKLLEAPSSNEQKPLIKMEKLIAKVARKKASSSDIKPFLQYNYPVDSSENHYEDLDKVIEQDSMEYKWSPHPELESLDDTPEEDYDNDTKSDICKYLHEECETYMKSGVCSDGNRQVKGMKKFCKTTCGFCD